MNYPAFCLMPDHLHIIYDLYDENDNVIDIVNHFKRKISFILKNKHPLSQLWQDRFIDHIIRSEKELKRIARYIFYNPVRKGLVKDYKDWPYSGGYLFKKWF